VKIAIIGLPQSGKTTVFNAAAGKTEAVGDYSKASHRAVIKVPDDRLEKLCEGVNPRKITHAEIEYIDISAFSGKGKETAATTIEMPEDVKYADALMVVIDCFSPDCSPLRHFNLFNEEMILSDQVIIERNLEKKARTAQLTGDQETALEAEVLKKCLNCLEEGRPLSQGELDAEAIRIVTKYCLLSLKPLLIVLNIPEGDIGAEDKWLAQFADLTIPGARETVALCGKIEMELAALAPDDRAAFLADLGIARPAMELLIQKSYSLVGLIVFFTVGEPEGRAWTIRKGTNARKAAGVIHSDIERGFIRAEVISYADFERYGSQHAAKEAGKFRVEGKDYVVADGDIILFRFNI
jgi:GTP-binding protein YchF